MAQGSEPRSLRPVPRLTEKSTRPSTLECYHWLVMTLCGFIKGEGESLCHRACENGEGERGSRTPGKLPPREERGDPGALGEFLQAGRTQRPGLSVRAHGRAAASLSSNPRECWCGADRLCARYLTTSLIWTVFH